MVGRRGNSEGTITQRADGRWEARVSLPDGKRKSFYGKTRREVERALSQARRDIENGLPVANDKQLVDQYMKSWLDMMKHLVKPTTWRRYGEFVRLHIVPELGKHPLVKLSPQHLQAFYAKKLDDGLSPTTVHHIHTMLHRALGNALKIGLVQRNVTEVVDPPRMRRHEMMTFTPEQARAFLRAAEGDRLEALYVLALSSGMREGELLGLRWQDVDLEQATIQVRATLQFINGEFVLSEPKSTRSRRHLSISKRAVEALRQHRIRQLQERLALGPSWDDTWDLVFPNTIGKPMHQSNFYHREFQGLLSKAGLPMIRFHDLRHTAATLLLRQGVNPKIVSTILGHAQVSMTLDVYSHVTPDMQQVAVDAMDKALGG